MRRLLFLSFAISSCFNINLIGGQISCPDGVCPDGFVCEPGLCFDGDQNCGGNLGFCATLEGTPCLTNIGCTPTPECAVIDGTAQECVLGTVCVDDDTLEDVPAFQQGDVAGTCVAQVELDAGDDCEEGDVVNVCPNGTGCNNGTCADLTGEPGDTCALALQVSDGVTSFHTGGFADDSQVDLDFNVNNQDICDIATATGGDIFFSYTVVGPGNVDVRISTSSLNTFADTVLYVGAACDANGVKLLQQLACDDDQVADDEFNDFTSELVVQNQAAGTTILIVVDSFIGGRENFVDMTITEE